MKKKRIIIIILLVDIAFIFGWQLYLFYHPDAELRIMKPERASAVHMDNFTYALNSRGILSRWVEFHPKSYDEHAKEFIDRTTALYIEVSETYVAPIDVNATVRKEHGKTYVNYSGIVTTTDGETIDFEKELVFDFELYYQNELD